MILVSLVRLYWNGDAFMGRNSIVDKNGNFYTVIDSDKDKALMIKNNKV